MSTAGDDGGGGSPPRNPYNAEQNKLIDIQREADAQNAIDDILDQITDIEANISEKADPDAAIIERSSLDRFVQRRGLVRQVQIDELWVDANPGVPVVQHQHHLEVGAQDGLMEGNEDGEFIAEELVEEEIIEEGEITTDESSVDESDGDVIEEANNVEGEANGQGIDAFEEGYWLSPPKKRRSD